MTQHDAIAWAVAGIPLPKTWGLYTPIPGEAEDKFGFWLRPLYGQQNDLFGGAFRLAGKEFLLKFSDNLIVTDYIYRPSHIVQVKEGGVRAPAAGLGPRWVRNHEDV
jgi:hypothetical protein